MRGTSSFPKLLCRLILLTLLCSIVAPLAAQDSVNAQTPTAVSASPLINEPVDERKLTTLKGNVHPLARPQSDLGTAPASLPMQRMLLVLKRSPQQESALRKLLDDQQDKHSPNYHKWLTPEQYGKQFGPSDSDMQAINGWLQSHGFQLGAPSKGRTVVEFSGSASQVQEAFHTAIHKYVVKGEQHWANASDPQIPTALTPAVAGVLTLHNFLKRPTLHVAGQRIAAKVHPGKKPQVTLGDGTHALGPYDYATIYDSPAFNPGGVTGAGIIIAIVGRSNLFLSGGDITDFSNLFACCANFQIVLNGADPGDLGGGDETEATLDTTWAGAVAPGAAANLVVSASTNTADGVDLSEVYIIENNLAGIMTESFSSCEATATNAGGVAALAEQAAAQGITYFVSTGDSGAEGCDDPGSETVASGPVSVNVLASTDFNVAVGGTMFNENGQDSLYWNTANTNTESALSYIPEDVWNESCASCPDPGIPAGGGGVSIFSTSKPSWQSGVTGIPQDNARDLPDVSLTAGGHDGYIVCLEGSCVPDSSGNLSIFLIGGTSASTPSFAGIMALVEQQMANLNPGQSSRQGQANYVLYRLAASENATLSTCNGSSTSGLPGSNCIFNDVTVGNNAVPGELNYGSTAAQYQAGPGYDLATGLGSVNISNLVSQWNTVTLSPTTTTLALTPVINITHGSPVTASITVTPTSGTLAPTGDVSLLAFGGSSFTNQVAVDGFTLNNGTIMQSTNQLPGGGPYNVTAHYAGDDTYSPSDSAPVSVTVSPEASTTTLSVLTFDSRGNPVNFTGGSFGSFVYLRADVAGASGHGTPTGGVTFNDPSFGGIPFIPVPSPLNSGEGLNNGSSSTTTPQGVILDAGTHAISATYAGDASFNASASAPAITFTISPGFFVTLDGPSHVVIPAPGGTGTNAVQVTYSTGVTGTIALTCSGLPAETTCTFSPPFAVADGTFFVTTASLAVTTTGPHTVTSRNIRQSRYLLARYLTCGGFALAGFFFLGSPKRRHTAIFFLMILLAFLVMLPACGGGGGGGSKVTTTQDPGTPTNTTPIIVTVNATNGANTSSTSFALVVQ